MRYFVPELALGVLLPEETELVEKFGGLPYGLPPDKWPVCGECGLPLSHLFTLKHDAERLDLGKNGRVLMAFMCNHDPGICGTWDMDSGANSVLILEESERGSGWTYAPEPSGAQTETEAFVAAWRQAEDVVPEAEATTFSDVQLKGDLLGESWSTLYNTTKLGSLPAWVQFPEGPPVPPFRFAGQFDSSLFFHGLPPSAMQAFCPVYRWDEVTKQRHEEKPREGWVPPPGGPSALYVSDDNTYRCDGPNYGGGGMAYLFLTTPSQDEMPQGKFLWQCT